MEAINRLIALALKAKRLGHIKSAHIYTNAALRLIQSFNIMPPVPQGASDHTPR